MGQGAEHRTTIGEQLERARRRRFVGRHGELELFQKALTSPEPPFSVMYLHGPGGVGKTALLARFAAAASAEGASVGLVDVRHCGPSPGGLMNGFRKALGLSEDDPLSAASAGNGRTVILLDTYEAAASSDGWVRDELLPALPADVVVVLAGRDPPAEGWRTDAGWNELLRVVPLGNLSDQESSDLLRSAGVPAGEHQEALAYSHGHPLALSLLADIIEQQGPLGTLGLRRDPDIVRVLSERFTEGIPAPRYRHALEACSFVRAMTEALLCVALDIDDAGELFNWLRCLSFVDESPHGLLVHDLVRDVLDADLRWRDPNRYQQVRRRMGRHMFEEIRASSGIRQQRLLFDVRFLHRSSPEVRRIHDWDAIGEVGVEEIRREDRAQIVAMTRRHEGDGSAGLAELWLDRQRDAFSAFRGPGGLLGYCCYLKLNEVDAVDRDTDPGTRAVWAFVERNGSVRPEEDVTFVRFIMDAQSYQSPSSAFDHRVTITGRNFFSNPRLAWDFIAVQDPYPLCEEMEYYDYPHLPEAGFTVGGRRFSVFAHDWRRRPIAMWARLMAQRGLLADPTAQPDQGTSLQLSRPEFDAAVKAALRNLTRPTLVADNPLLGSRLAGRHPTGARSAAALAARVRAAVEALAADPRDQKLYRALDRTYLRPAQTQEHAAEVLGLPFSTYRRHLARGVARVANALWYDAYPLNGAAFEHKMSSD